MGSLNTDIQLPVYGAPPPDANSGQPDTLSPVLINAGDDSVGQPYIYLDQETVVVSGKSGQGLLIDPLFGTTITGPIALFETPDNMFIGGGYWQINPIQLQCIGSSSAIPIPWLLPSTPRLLAAAGSVQNSVSLLKSSDPSITSL